MNVKFISGYNEFFNAVAFTGGEVSENFQNETVGTTSFRKCYITSGIDALEVVVNGEHITNYKYYNGNDYCYECNEGDTVDFYFSDNLNIKS